MNRNEAECDIDCGIQDCDACNTCTLSFPSLPSSSLSLTVTAEMKLTPSAGSDRAWVWTVQADFADEEAKAEQLAIRFKNRESEET